MYRQVTVPYALSDAASVAIPPEPALPRTEPHSVRINHTGDNPKSNLPYAGQNCL